jgi:hypothetical protein
MTRREIKHSKFRQSEDDEIRRVVAQHGTKNWPLIAAEIGGGRTKRQVRERWHNYLNPALKREYTEADDQFLESWVEQICPKWSTIAVCLPGKSGVSVRNRYRTLQTLRMKGFKPDYERMAVMHQSPESISSERDEGTKPRWQPAPKPEQVPQQIVTDEIDDMLNDLQFRAPTDWDSDGDSPRLRRLSGFEIGRRNAINIRTLSSLFAHVHGRLWHFHATFKKSGETVTFH